MEKENIFTWEFSFCLKKFRNLQTKNYTEEWPLKVAKPNPHELGRTGSWSLGLASVGAPVPHRLHQLGRTLPRPPRSACG